MSVSRNNMNSDTDSDQLKLQVNFIRFSKHIKNPFQLKEKTGMNMYSIHHILKNEDTILEKWRDYLSKNPTSNTHADDCDGIDTLLLEWVTRCKSRKKKLGMLEITRQLINLTNLLKISSYYHIKQSLWTRIEEILDHKSPARLKKFTQSLEPCTLLELLKNDGWRLLQPQTYEKFFEIINENSLDSSKDVDRKEHDVKNVHTSKQHTLSKQQTAYLEKGTTHVTSIPPKIDFPGLPATITLVPKNVCTNVPIKKEPVKCTNDKIIVYHLTPVLVKTETDTYIKGEKMNELPEQEPDLMIIPDTNDVEIVEILESDEEDNKTVDEVVYKYPPVLYQEIKQEPGFIEDDGKCCAKIKVENCDEDIRSWQEIEQICSKETQDNDTKNPDTYFDNETDDEIQVVFEIEDSDEDVKKELMEIINKYANENPDQENIKIEKLDIKQELLIEEVEPAKEKPTAVINILTDEKQFEGPIQTPNSQTNLKQHLKNMKRTTNDIENNQNIKRTKSNMEDNLPSTSKSSISGSTTTSSDYLTKLCIKNNLEAYKCLHLVKDFFQLQRDDVGSKLVTTLMMSFLSSSNTLEKGSSDS